MFGSYEGDLMARPSQEVLERIRGSFHDFLEREDLLLVEPILQQVITVPGYGATTEVHTYNSSNIHIKVDCFVFR